MTDFTTRLTNWLEQQPEYPTLFLADRPARRRAAKSLAKQVLILPTMDRDEANRKARRASRKVVGRMVGKANTNMSRRAQRQLFKAERDRARWLRLSGERKVQLLQRHLAQALEAQALEESDPALD